MFDFYLNNLSDFNIFEKLFITNNQNKDIVLLCIGTNKYFQDSFGPRIGANLKKHKLFVYGSSFREVNGTNYERVYKFIRKKHPSSKIIVIDSVYIKGEKKPILIYKNEPIKVSVINEGKRIGDEGILFNSFSYSNLDIYSDVMTKLEEMFLHFKENISKKK